LTIVGDTERETVLPSFKVDLPWCLLAYIIAPLEELNSLPLDLTKLTAALDNSVAPTKVLFGTVDNTLAHKTAVIKVTASANGVSTTFEIHRKIDPCPRATIVKPTTSPSQMVIRAGSF